MKVPSLRSTLDALPSSPGRRAIVVAALAVGGLVALLVPLFFAVMLIGILRG